MAIHYRLFYLLLALIPTQLGLHLWPEWAHVLGRRIDYLSPTLFFTDILCILIIFFWLKGRGLGHILPVPWKKGALIYGSFLLGAGFITVNILLALSPPVAMYKWFKVFEFALLGWYIFSTKPTVATVIKYVSFGVLYSSVLAIAQFALQHSVGGFFWVLGERTFSLNTPGISRFDFCFLNNVPCALLLRPYGTFSHPNVLGGFLASTLPIILFMLLSDRLKVRNMMERVYYWTALVLGLVTLILTFSRSAWIVGGLGLVVMGLVFVSGKYAKIYDRVPRSVVTLLALVALGIVWLSIVFAPSVAGESVVRRVELNRAAIDMWRESPIFGKGLGNYIVALPENSVNRYINFIQPVHNVFLLVLSEIGIAGITLSALLFWHMVKKAKLHFVINPFWFAAIGYVVLIGFVDHYPISLQQGQLWSIVLLGLILRR